MGVKMRPSFSCGREGSTWAGRSKKDISISPHVGRETAGGAAYRAKEVGQRVQRVHRLQDNAAGLLRQRRRPLRAAGAQLLAGDEDVVAHRLQSLQQRGAEDLRARARLSGDGGPCAGRLWPAPPSPGTHRHAVDGAGVVDEEAELVPRSPRLAVYHELAVQHSAVVPDHRLRGARQQRDQEGKMGRSLSARAPQRPTFSLWKICRLGKCRGAESTENLRSIWSGKGVRRDRAWDAARAHARGTGTREGCRGGSVFRRSSHTQHSCASPREGAAVEANEAGASRTAAAEGLPGGAPRRKQLGIQENDPGRPGERAWPAASAGRGCEAYLRELEKLLQKGLDLPDLGRTNGSGKALGVGQRRLVTHVSHNRRQRGKAKVARVGPQSSP